MSFQLGEKRKWLAGYASHLHTQSTLLNTLIHKNTHTHEGLEVTLWQACVSTG